MPLEVACPSCLRLLHVREEHLGGRVSCPVCGTVFQPAAAAVPNAENVEPRGEDRVRRRRRFRRNTREARPESRLLAPGICLIVFGALVTLFYLLNSLLIFADVGRLTPQPAAVQRMDKSWFKGLSICSSCLVVMGSAVIIVGGIKMLQRDHRKAALTASILAMIPCTAGLGCLAGIPLGIWCLIVLRDRDVIATFRDEPRAEMETEW